MTRKTEYLLWCPRCNRKDIRGCNYDRHIYKCWPGSAYVRANKERGTMVYPASFPR